MSRSRRWILIILLVAVVVSVSIIVATPRPSFDIDPNHDWRIEFGRGSGMDGLDTVAIDQTGEVVMHQHRRPRGHVETARAKLDPDALSRIIREASALTALHKAYHANIHDGTQWVLWIRQGENEKAVYFNNNFPAPIVRFANTLDELTRGLPLEWKPVPEEESERHQRALWDSIGRESRGGS